MHTFIITPNVHTEFCARLLEVAIMSEPTGPEAIQRALQRRRELEEEIREIDLFLSLYEQFAGHPVSVGAMAASVVSDTSKPRRGRKRGGGGMSQEDFIALARDLLLEIGRPVNGPALLEKFHEKGRHIGGADEIKNLTTKIWRARDRIIKIPGAGYWPVEVPCPEVSYEPPPDGIGETGEES